MQRDSSRAFTLIELLVVITIIIILASIAYPVYTNVQERARATQDMNNLRQIGLATQMYLNDNDNLIFSSDPAVAWMTQLKTKYLPAWKIFQSPFDKRSPLENDTTAPISYGLNGNTKAGGKSIAGLLSDKIKNASAFILFAPAQAAGTTVSFSGTPAAAVTVYKAGAAAGGTHSGRKRINVLFADLHSEPMTWSNFIKDDDPNDPTAAQRWDPYQPYP
jgi:prepilin-type N-terminal cleavage/methylation domain-containing protein/prepilin-type processing-associated H-X9-DG protein